MGAGVGEIDWDKERARFWGPARDEQLSLGLGEYEAEAETALQWARLQRRLAWLRSQFDEIERLHDALGDYWGAFFDAHPELDHDDVDESELPDPPEQAELDRIHAAIARIVERDEWPRELYFARV